MNVSRTLRDQDTDRKRVAQLWRNEIGLARKQGWQGPIAGVDEAGRGPLAGPVVAAAVILPRRRYLAALDDSKRLNAKVRTSLAEAIRSEAIAWSVAQVAVAEIDRTNILRASHQAMQLALQELGAKTEFQAALVDGLSVATLGFRHLAVVGGDGSCPSIAAASVLAKVHRDALMAALDVVYPQYGFARHKGYPTPEHIAALRRYGPCNAHRQTFRCRQVGLFADEAGTYSRN